jgi:hypothetical protein
VPSYTVGYIDVYRNGVMLGTADFTATTGTTVVLASGATTGDLIRAESLYVSSVLNAIPATVNSVARTYMPVGSVLQTVINSQNLTASYFQTSSNTLVATGLSVSIAPTTATSKIIITVNAQMGTNTPGASATGCYATIYRNGSVNLAGSQSNASLASLYSNTTTVIFGSGNMVAIDSPATTASTSYQVYFGCQQTGGNSIFGAFPGPPAGYTILMMAQEIAA